MFCNSCGVHKAIRHERETEWAVRQMNSPKMMTLTLNRENWSSPLDAYLYVMGERLIARLVRDLDRTHEMINLKDGKRHYVSVLELHKPDKEGREWPHWHILIDSDYTDYKVVERIWNSYAPEVDFVRKNAHVPMGYIEVTWTKGEDDPKKAARKAARYVSKYLAKMPENWPDWILNTSGIRRIQHSQGFRKAFGLDEFWMTDEEQEKTAEQPAEQEEQLYCIVCNGKEEWFRLNPETGELVNVEADKIWAEQAASREGDEEEQTDSKSSGPQCVGARIASCRQKTVMLKQEIWQRQDRSFYTLYFYVDTFDEPWEMYKHLADTDIDAKTAEDLISAYRNRRADKLISATPNVDHPSANLRPDRLFNVVPLNGVPE